MTLNIGSALQPVNLHAKMKAYDMKMSPVVTISELSLWGTCRPSASRLNKTAYSKKMLQGLNTVKHKTQQHIDITVTFHHRRQSLEDRLFWKESAYKQGTYQTDEEKSKWKRVEITRQYTEEYGAWDGKRLKAELGLVKALTKQWINTEQAGTNLLHTVTDIELSNKHE